MSCDSPHKSYFLYRFEIQILLKKKIGIFVIMGPHGGEYFKTLYIIYSYSFASFSSKLFLHVLCDNPRRSYL